MKVIELHHGEFSFLNGRSNVISWAKSVKKRLQGFLGKSANSLRKWEIDFYVLNF